MTSDEVKIKSLKMHFDNANWQLLEIDYLAPQDLENVLQLFDGQYIADYYIFDDGSESDFNGPGTYVVIPPKNVEDFKAGLKIFHRWRGAIVTERDFSSLETSLSKRGNGNDFMYHIRHL
ncbi:MAG: hypothetical protein GC136_02625 [Alphaproteobacteria bacterium]|nr:hypothetical protein [Alphaproteobacteria bacterium]